MEIEYARENLKRNNLKVDYIFSHCFTSKWENREFGNSNPNQLTDFFQLLQYTVEYKKWYFGHYHKDKTFDDKHICVYKNYYKLN